MPRTSVYGNAKLIDLGTLAKAVSIIIKETEIEYDDPFMQSLLRQLESEIGEIIKRDDRE